MYSSLGRETGRQGPKLSRGVAGPSGKVSRRWEEKVDMVGMSGRVEVTLGVLPETSMSVRDPGCNTNQLWQIEAENKFIERLVGSSQNFWEDWITRLKNLGAETGHRGSLLRPDNEAITVPTGNQRDSAA